MRTKLFLLTIPLLLWALLGAGCGDANHDGHAKAQKYHCPMHPTYISDKPGDCPICNMKLVPIKDEPTVAAAPARSEASAAKPGQYTCPMHPKVVSDGPGSCPDCGMDLEEVPAADPHAGHRATAAPAPVPGRIAVSISPEKQQLIGLTTEQVSIRKLTQPVRATATLEHDETRLARIAPRFAGWVRDLKVNYTGQKVAKGDPLFTVYSPELFEAESEYLLAFQRVAQLQSREDTTQTESAKRLLESARRKLSLWEIGELEIAELEKTGQARDEILVRSPASGHVVTKNAVQGRAFMAGETLYEIADLSHLWVRAYIFEFEAPLIKEGQSARVTFPYLGNRSIESRVTFLYPHIDPQTRRAEVRLEIDNPQHDLRPQMWANVELEASFGEVLTVPASAIIDTGVRLVAFVMRDDNHLEPREVTIGARSDDYYQVLSGLNDGEKVVARALFLIDSESQLKAAISGMGSAGGHNH
ncbi:MAG: efflux RND transporter periplasmic adaptor subunit [Opitutaceae bacterium]|nr:efflux RND transporter periplasmic adaptor subunit [Opitutaceae bacterium]